MKKAFTMLELVFVIVVIGIISTIALSRDGSNRLREAAVQVLSHIRYTQHLAMLDDKFNMNTLNWFRARWQILFQLDNSGNGNQIYLIYSDNDLDNAVPENGEIALNPTNRRQMTGNSTFNNRTPNMDLTQSYGIANVTFAGGCAGSQRIMFDNLGRPYLNDTTVNANLLVEQCNITFTGQDGANFIIDIEPETGYANIR